MLDDGTIALILAPRPKHVEIELEVGILSRVVETKEILFQRIT